MAMQVDGTQSLNLDQPSVVDINLRSTPAFVTEGSRPVYARLADVDVGSGLLAPAAGRELVGLGHVIQHRSDLRSFSQQFAVTLAPALAFSTPWFAAGTYTWSRTTAQFRGFDQTTASDPRQVEWGASPWDMRHQVHLQGGLQVGGVAITMFGRLMSGLPYTPLISTDVNGDGRANDRARVPALDGALDAANERALRQLLTSGVPSARSCLAGQIGQLAHPNSCRMPWTTTLNIRVAIAGETLRLSRRGELSLNIANPLAAVDQLLHGSRLHGWGSSGTVDPTLLTTTGFDAATQAFQYAINPHFGTADGTLSAYRIPTRVTLDFRMDLGAPVAGQQLGKMLRAGRSGRPGPRLSAPQIMARYARNVADPFRALIGASDSLFLTAVQVDSLASAQQRYRTAVDSVWSALAHHLAALGDRFDQPDALRRQEAATDEAWEIGRVMVRTVAEPLLTPLQRRLAPWPANLLLASPGPINVRVYRP
jgi:hypothetical protein